MSLERQLKRWENLKEQPKIIILECKVCDYTDNVSCYKILKSKDIFNAGELIRYQCPNCDLIFGDLRFLNMSIEEIGKDYEDVYSYYSENSPKQRILDAFNKLDLDKKLLGLDYACGKDIQHIDVLNNKGYNLFCYDKYVKVDSIYFLNNLEEKHKNYFDYIVSNNFIEHVIDPIEDIKFLLEYIKKDGLLIFITDCFDYCIEFTHYHTFYFLEKSIRYLEEKCNIKLLKTIYKDKKQFTKIFKKL